MREGKKRLRNVEFALAYGVARDILELKPGSPAGLMIMGDALKGWKREDALKLYLKAEHNAHMYLEPLKKIVEFYKEEGDQNNALNYLTKIDELSPLHVGRKKEIGELYFMQGHTQNAAHYYLDTVKLMHQLKQPDCVHVSEDYAEKIYNKDTNASVPLFEICVRLAKHYRADLHWSIYNRLGMLLRRQKRWREAIDAYVHAASLSPRDESILFNMGMAYVEGKGLWQCCGKNFERAIKTQSIILRRQYCSCLCHGTGVHKGQQDKERQACTLACTHG